MDKTDNTQGLNIVMNGITINGPMFDIHDNGTVENHYHFQAPPTDTPLTVSDVKMKETLEQLLNATDGEGKKMFTQQQQWYAVYRVLSEEYGYPKIMTDFCGVMSDIGMKDVQPPCTYQSLKKVSQKMPLLSCKTNLWGSYLNRAESNTKKQIEIALKLMDLLAETRQ